MPWDRELQALERAIAAVNAEYDTFLYGTAARPPVESRRHVERLIRSLSAQEPEAAGERFRFSALQGRWSTLCERWERLQAEKEAGRRPGLYGHFRPSQGHDGEIPKRFSGAGGSSDGPLSPPAAPVPAPAAASPPNAAAAPSVDHPEEPLPDPRRNLYERYVAAKKARGEPGEGVDFERFADSLEREANRLKDRFGGAEVEFDVAERDGRVKLVARKKT